MLTTNKITTGTFEVLWNGEKTSYQIINGSLGLSGHDTQNVYGIVKPDGSVRWIGPLVSCKKAIELTLKNEGKAA